MKLVDRNETVLVVVGAGEQNRDRQVAEFLKSEIDSKADGQAYRRAIVVGDMDYLNRPDLHRHPTIAIGGPGVNLVSGRLLGELPMVWQQEDRAFIQADEDGRRAAIWGIDAKSTEEAVEAFVHQHMLGGFLDRIWQFRPESMM